MKQSTFPQKLDRCSKCVAQARSAFKNLNPKQTECIDGLRQPEWLLQGQSAPLDSENNYFYCVQSGQIKVECTHLPNSPMTRVCGPGDLVGYLRQNEQSITALKDTQLCRIDAKAFQALQNKEPEISLGIIEALTQVISEKDEQIAGLENHCVKNRIASMLFVLMKKFGVPSEVGVLIDVKLDRRAMAQLSGTVVESMARAITELESEKIVQREGRKIHVLDPEKLGRLSQAAE